MKRVVGCLSAVALLVSAVSVSAAEPTKAECFSSNNQAQTFRREGKFQASRNALRICVSAACPGMVRDDCSQRLDELDRVQPSIVFDAKDGAGHDVSIVKVTLDGQPFAEKLDGSALLVDPGEHSFTFEVAGQPAVTQKFVIHEGDKSRRERIVIGLPPESTTAPTNPGLPRAVDGPSSSVLTHSGGGSTQRTVGLVLGGVGIVGVGLGIAFGASAISSWSKAKSECSEGQQNCPNEGPFHTDRDSAVSAGTISTITFIAGGALVAGGLLLFFTAPSGKKDSVTGHALRIAPSVGPGGGGVLLRGSF